MVDPRELPGGRGRALERGRRTVAGYLRGAVVWAVAVSSSAVVCAAQGLPVEGGEPAGAPAPVAGAGEGPAAREPRSAAAAARGAKRVTINGVAAIDDATAREWLVDQINFIGFYGVSTARADDAAFFLEQAYRSRGFNDARVEWSLDRGGEHITLTVDEGRRLEVGEVTIEGNDPGLMPDEAILELLTSKTRDELGLRKADTVPFVRGDINHGVEDVRNYYHVLSYLDAEVEMAEPVLPAPGSGSDRVPLSLKVREGMPHRVGAVHLGAPPDPGLEEEFEAIRTKYQGSNLTPGTLGLIEQDLNGAARGAGYFEREIEVTFEPPTENGGFKESDVHVNADYGDRYIVRDVVVSGNERVDDRVFDMLFGGAAGEVYDPDRFDKRVRRMLATGAFEKITIEPEPHDDASLTLDMSVAEAKSRRVGVFGGYGTYEGPIVGLDVRDVVLWGRVQQINLSAEYSGRGLRGNLGYKNPWLFWSEWSFGANLFIRTRENEGYDIGQAGLEFDLRREFGERHAVTFLAGAEYSATSSAGIDEEFLGPEDYFNNGIGVAYDYVQWGRNQAARRGLKANAVFGVGSVTGDARTEYARLAGGLAYHLPIKKAEFSVAARAGAIAPTEEGSLPIDMRYFSGGSRSVRSFRERDLGPKNNGYPIGGEFYTTFNAEVAYPVWGGIKLAVFGDAGNLLPKYEDASLDMMHYAAGAGLRYDLPIGPLRVDYGFNLNRGENEPSGSWHITFGFAF